jgi:membrane glycosyltransferase
MLPEGSMDNGLTRGDRPALPPEKPTSMLPQTWAAFAGGQQAARPPEPRVVLVRFAIFASATALAAYLVRELALATAEVEWSGTRIVLLALFAASIFWLAVLRATAVIGMVALLCWRNRSMVELTGAPAPQLQGRTAILMPIFGESPERVFGAALAILRSLQEERYGRNFDFFMLSDTTDPAVWAREESCFELARRLLTSQQCLYYRRRPLNAEKKAGNIAEWCRRWGGAYDYMVVLDADSLMSGKALVQLAKALEHNPDVGLIQPPSILINRQTLFGRYQQFANRVYDYWCPAMTAGMACWHGDSSSYWGHNAIIRVRAFCDSCGLPRLPGQPPFGGPVQSHDFVEGALLRRAGWRVCLMPQVEESYEEAPPTILDWAVRERRWCQGNFQHARILLAAGLSWVSRVHLVSGIMYMVSAILWILSWAAAAAIVFSVGETLRSCGGAPCAAGPASIVLVSVLLLLVLPRLIGFSLTFFSRNRRQAFGGVAALLKGMALDAAIAAVFSPVRVILRAGASLDVLRGRDSGWWPARRDDRYQASRNLMRFHANHMGLGLGLALVSPLMSPVVFLGLLPVCVCLAASGPFSVLLARADLGLRARAAGFLLTPEETHPPPVAVSADGFREFLSREHGKARQQRPAA